MNVWSPSWSPSLVSVGNNINSRRSPVASPTISRALLPMMSEVDKLPMDTEPIAHDNKTIFTLKLGDQTFVPPYLTDNRSRWNPCICNRNDCCATSDKGYKLRNVKAQQRRKLQICVTLVCTTQLNTKILINNLFFFSAEHSFLPKGRTLVRT